jgi:hypothetical protein
VGIPHRSSADGQIDPVEDDCVDLGQTERNGDVSEVRQDVGSVGVGARGSGVVGVRRNRRYTVTATADSGELFQEPGGASGTGGKGEKERGLRAFYRSGLDGPLVCGDGAGVTPAGGFQWRR